MTVKKCSSCKFTMPFSFFNRRRQSPDGLAYKCRICDNQSSRKWRKANPERMSELSKRHYEANKDRAVELARVWVANNPEARRNATRRYFLNHKDAVNARNKKWRDANVSSVRRIAMKRHTAKLGATPKWLSADQLSQIDWFYTHARDCEIVSGETYQVDHIVPLQGRNVCGLHVPWNLQILPRDLNASKGNKWHD